MPEDIPIDAGDLGFTHRRRKDGVVEVLHQGVLAATLRGREAEALLARAPDPATPAAQQLMARITGNYKRGNERHAAVHPRNRG